MLYLFWLAPGWLHTAVARLTGGWRLVRITTQLPSGRVVQPLVWDRR